MEIQDAEFRLLGDDRGLDLRDNPVDLLEPRDYQELFPNPAELMVLGANPTRRRRRRTGRRKTRTRVRISVPKRAKRNPTKARRRRRPSRLLRRSRKRPRRNPAVAIRRDEFRWKDLPTLIFSGSAGAFCGSGGYYISKMVLPPEWDRHILGYAAHGAAGTGLALGVGWGMKAVGFRPSYAALIGAAWGTVAFRILLNTWFSKIPRPIAAIKASMETTTKGLSGIEEAIPAGYDVGDMDDQAEMLELAHVSRRFLSHLSPDQVYEEEVAGQGKQGPPDYIGPEPYDVGQEYTPPQPYDVGQEYTPPQPYDVGQEYQPARALPAASMPVGQQYEAPQPYDVGQMHQEAPELGAYSKTAPSQWSPLWGMTG